MNLVRLADTAQQPWRNGGGTTQELLAWPNAANWQLRVSVARITQDGDFSAWPGMGRWFAVLEGNGVKLALPEGSVELDTGSQPLHFAGEAAPHCTLTNGATQDLNLMVKRDSGVGEMRRATAGSRATAFMQWRALYSADELTLELDGAVMPVAAGTLLWLPGEEPVGWQVLEEGKRAWWMSWRPA